MVIKETVGVTGEKGIVHVLRLDIARVFMEPQLVTRVIK